MKNFPSYPEHESPGIPSHSPGLAHKETHKAKSGVFPILVFLSLWAGILAQPVMSQRYYWLPPDVDTLRGVFIEQHGSRSLGVPSWQEFARQKKFALVFGGPDITKELEAVLKDFAVKTGHPEFEHVPVCMFGGSMGGWFSMQVADKYPARTIASIGGFCGIWPTSSGVPAIFPITEKDNNFYNASKTIDKDFTDSYFPNRAKGALWTAAVIWGGTEHGMPSWQDLSMAYFDQIIDYRVPADQNALKGPVTLQNYKEEEGWLSDLYLSKLAFPTFQPHAEYTGEKSRAVWFPNAYVAWLWRAFISTDSTVKITSPQLYLQKSKDIRTPLLSSSDVTIKAEGPPAVKKIAFHDGDRYLGQATSAPYEVKVCLDPGLHTLIAVATAADDKQTSSKPVIVVVKGDGKTCPGTSLINPAIHPFIRGGAGSKSGKGAAVASGRVSALGRAIIPISGSWGWTYGQAGKDASKVSDLDLSR